MNIRTLDDARWSCRGCSDCCRGFAFGPVEPAVIAGLQAADIASQWAPAAQAPWHSARAAPDGSRAHFLTHRDGHCVFLQDDGRCAVHRLLGEAAKPWFCREYPFHVVEEAGGGVSVAVRADCGGLHHSFADGEPVAAQAAAVLALPRIVPRPRFDTDQVVILPGIGISAENWAAVEGHVLSLLAAPMPPEQALSATRNLLYQLAGRPAPAPSPQRLAHALQALFSALAEAAAAPGAPPPFRPKLAEAAALLGRLSAAAPLPALDEPAQRYLSLVLRGAILTRRFATIGGLPAAMGLFFVETAAARLASAVRAPLRPADVGETLPGLLRAMHLPPLWQRLRASRPLLEAVFLNAGAPAGP